MNNLMIDIETLSTQPNGVIVSIGAVFFNLDDGRIGKQFSEQICRGLSEQDGFVTDQATLDWWDKQSQIAKDMSLLGESKPQEVMVHLEDWIRTNADCEIKDLIVWANAPSFDLVMLLNHFKRYNMTPPWRYYNERDVRTYKSLADNLGVKEDDYKAGVKHTAIDDCTSQIKLVSRVQWSINNLIKDAEKLTHILSRESD